MNMRPDPANFPAALRQRIEQAIENLLALLDTMDGDADLEPSLGAPEVWLPEVIGFVPNCFHSTSQEHWSAGRGDEEQEEQHDAEEDPAEVGICDVWSNSH